MRPTKRQWYLGMAAVPPSPCFWSLARVGLNAQQSTGPRCALIMMTFGGIVTSVNGPEAGVWVIAGDHESSHQVR